MKSRDGKRREEEKRSKRESLRRKKIQVRERRKGRKVAKHCFVPMICGSGGSKSRLAKAAGAEPAGQMRDEKLHAVVARSTFAREEAKNISHAEHFWKLRCRKSARRCGAKHVSKSKCWIYLTFGPILEVAMSKKCTPLRREAHFEVKMLKTPHVRTTFGSWDVEKVHAVVARSTFRSQNVQNTRGLDNFWTFRVQMSFCVAGARDCAPCQKWAKREGFVAFSTTTTTTLHSTTLHYTPLHYTRTTLHYIPLHSTTLSYTTLRYTTLQLHYTTFHYTTLHYTTLLYTTLHWMTLQYTTPTTTTTTATTAATLHYITLH